MNCGCCCACWFAVDRRCSFVNAESRSCRRRLLVRRKWIWTILETFQVALALDHYDAFQSALFLRRHLFPDHSFHSSPHSTRSLSPKRNQLWLDRRVFANHFFNQIVHNHFELVISGLSIWNPIKTMTVLTTSGGQTGKNSFNGDPNQLDTQSTCEMVGYIRRSINRCRSIVILCPPKVYFNWSIYQICFLFFFFAQLKIIGSPAQDRLTTQKLLSITLITVTCLMGFFLLTAIYIQTSNRCVCGYPSSVIKRTMFF